MSEVRGERPVATRSYLMAGKAARLGDYLLTGVVSGGVWISTTVGGPASPTVVVPSDDVSVELPPPPHAETVIIARQTRQMLSLAGARSMRSP
jgi:hypothetical protein